MFTLMRSEENDGFQSRYHGALALGALLWMILSLSNCSSSGKQYVVDYARGDDSTAEGSRQRPCQTEVQCQKLAERDGVQSYWMVYQ